MENSNHTILVVDDEPANLRMLERLLRRKFKVITAPDGEQALEILKREKVSLILTDQRMPGMSGTELLNKSRQIDPDMVRMVVTANNDTNTFIDAIKNAGAIRVIAKPWDPDKVMADVSSALEKYELTQRNKQAMNQLKQANEELNRMVRR
jgi:response regulator RpfG family c-di-GMP phosphodiesterase